MTADWVDKAFYIWVSVFALFHVSVFWSFMAETFNQNQAARLFSVIAAGASLGAIIGPLISAVLVQVLKPQSMMLVCAALYSYHCQSQPNCIRFVHCPRKQ